LVNTVKGFAKHESGVFTQIAEARAQLAGARSVPDKISANNNLDSALSRLLVVVENYPQLKADKNFIALQDELSGTENRIAVARRNYNAALQNYNTMIRMFPGNIAAAVFGFQKKDAYFEAAETAKAVPQVDFNN
jgi:LemA protein